MAALGFTRASQQDIFSIESSQPCSSRSSSVLSGEEARLFYESVTKEEEEQPSGAGSSERTRGSADSKRSRGSAVRERRRERSRGSADSERRRERSRGSADSERRRERSRGSADRLRSRGSTDRQGRVRPGQVQQAPSGASGRQSSSSERSCELLGLRLLRCAQEGDVPGLKQLLSKGADINFQDTYFWTAMMCASWSGQRAAVRLLLQRGAAWVGVVDTQGRDARDLALEAGHSEVLEELDTYGRSEQRQTEPDSSAAQRHRCDVCHSEYSGCQSSHLSSTLHQFSLQHPPPTPYYCLPPSSNSYKMMVRCGWKPGTGLGLESNGPQQPVSTVLKRDQEGLGYGQMKRAKVTHFQARDHDAVKAPARTNPSRGGKGIRREESMRKEQKDKNWERDYRASFYL